VVAAGWLVATAAGAATGAVVGAAAGGLVGSLTGAGVPERDAQFYAEGVRRGGTLVTVRVDDARASTARELVQRKRTGLHCRPSRSGARTLCRSTRHLASWFQLTVFGI